MLDPSHPQPPEGAGGSATARRRSSYQASGGSVPDQHQQPIGGSHSAAGTGAAASAAAAAAHHPRTSLNTEIHTHAAVHSALLQRMGTAKRRMSTEVVDMLLGPHKPKDLMRFASKRGIAFQEKSFFCLDRHNWFRKTCIRTVQNPWFDRAVLLLILLNCLTLAMNDPTDFDPSSLRNQISDYTEIPFIVGFTVEMLIKMVAMGLFGSKSYFADRWNWIDFLVVISGYVSLLPNVSSVSALRSFRVLRPLRTLTSVPSIAVTVRSMLTSIPVLFPVFLLSMFLFFIFGIIGLQLWPGILQGRCFYPDPNNQDLMTPQPTMYCALSCSGDSGCSPAFDTGCAPVNVLVNSTLQSVASQCMLFGNPDDGLLSFDNIAVACLTMFTTITMEGWTDTMYAIMDAWGLPWLVALYFILLIMFGAFFMLNLALAVIWDEYVKATEAIEHEVEDAIRAAQLNASSAANAQADMRRGSSLLSARAAVAQAEPDGAGGPSLHEAISIPELDAVNAEPTDLRTRFTASMQRLYTLEVPSIQKVVEHTWFGYLIVLCIVCNTAALGAQFYGMTNEFADALNLINIIFTIIFAAEMVLKLLGLGVRGYLSDSFNVFEGAVVGVSLLEIVLTYTGALTSSSGLSALRSFRLMRVFRLARIWTGLRELLATISRSVQQVAHASIILFIFVFIFCLLGMQLLGAAMSADSDLQQTRGSFDSMWWAFITVFQVLTNENWPNVMYDAYNAVGPIAIAYFLLLQLVGNYLILNLFLAILLSNFETKDEDKTAAPDDRKSDATPAVQPSLMDTPSPLASPSLRVQPAHLSDPMSSSGDSPNLSPHSPSGKQSNRYRLVSVDDGSRAGSIVSLGNAAEGASSGRGAWVGADADAGAGGARLADLQGLKPDDNKPTQRSDWSWETIKTWLVDHDDYSLYLLGPDNIVRIVADRIVRHRLFEWLVLSLIAVSSVFLAVDEPWVEGCSYLPASDAANCIGLGSFLDTADIIITSIFVFEMVVKILAFGLAFNAKSYLRNTWNALDGAIVLVSIISLALGGNSQLRALRAFRALRALRPLRVVARYPGLRLVVNSLIGALPKVSHVLMVNLLFIFIFAVVGVQNFMGAMSTCNDPTVLTKDACVGDFLPTGDQCALLSTVAQQHVCALGNSSSLLPRIWQPVPENFDNLGPAMLTVFEVASGEMWPDIMYKAMDAVGTDLPMSRNNNTVAALFFILIKVVCSFFMLEIFTCVMVDNFNLMKEKSQGSAMLTEAQQLWVETMKMMLGVSPSPRMRRPVDSKVRQFFFDAVTWSYRPRASWLPQKLAPLNRASSMSPGTPTPMLSPISSGGASPLSTASARSRREQRVRVTAWPAFDILIMVLICVNTAIMALRYYGETAGYQAALDRANFVFACLFACEAVIKLLAYGPRQYFSVMWNRFDFTLVILSGVGELISLSQLATLFRIFRVGRIFRLVRASRGLSTLFKTLVFSIPQLVNVGAILMLLLFIYAVVGMNLFSDIKHGQYLNDHANFSGFFVSMLTLFRSSTGESFNGIMHDCMVQPPYCDPDTNCGFPVFAPLYFVSFYILVAFVFLNLLIAVILDNFSDTVRIDQSMLRDSDMEAFREAWSLFDPTASRYISAAKLPNLLLELDYPLGLRGMTTISAGVSMRKAARKVIAEMAVPERTGNVFFHEVLQALAKRVCKPTDIAVQVPILQDLQAREHRLMRQVVKAGPGNLLSEHIAAEMLQAAYRGRLARQRFKLAAKLSQRFTTPEGKASMALKLLRAGARKQDANSATAPLVPQMSRGSIVAQPPSTRRSDRSEDADRPAVELGSSAPRPSASGTSDSSGRSRPSNATDNTSRPSEASDSGSTSTSTAKNRFAKMAVQVRPTPTTRMHTVPVDDLEGEVID